MNARDAQVAQQVINSDAESVEQVIVSLGLTAPRVTPARIEEVVAHETYIVPPGSGTLTLCILTLQNGFTVTGESACASPENFNEELGRKIARRDNL